MLEGMVAEHYCSDAVRKREDLSWGRWGKRFNKYLARLEFLFSPTSSSWGRQRRQARQVHRQD